jgi:acetyl-CoA carboxylase beta subunit
MNFDQFLNRCTFGPDVEVEVKVVQDVPAATAITVIELLEQLLDEDQRVEVCDAIDTVKQAVALLRGEQP